MGSRHVLQAWAAGMGSRHGQQAWAAGVGSRRGQQAWAAGVCAKAFIVSECCWRNPFPTVMTDEGRGNPQQVPKDPPGVGREPPQGQD